jgi:hypothetical protein
MTDIDIEIESKLKAYRDEKQIFNIGALGTVLVITRKADTLGFPLQPDSLITKGGGQVSGLSGRAINKILQSHGVSNQVGTESVKWTPLSRQIIARFKIEPCSYSS